MSGDTLTGAALAEVVARASGCACRTAPCCPRCDCMIDARAALRAAVAAAGVDAEDIGCAAQSLSYAGNPAMWKVGDLLRALAEVICDE